MPWHDPRVITAVLAWNGIFFGLLKYFVGKILRTFETKLGTIDEIDRRLIHVETALQSRMPCSQYGEHTLTAQALHKRMDTLTSEVGKLTGAMGGMSRSVDLMNQFLIEQGGKK